MEERRQYGFRVRPNYGQVLGYIQEGEPIGLELPKRNASVYMASHFYLDDFPQSSEALSDQPMPHTHINPAEALEAHDQGYRGQPFPRPLSQGDAASLRMDGFDAPQPRQPAKGVGHPGGGDRHSGPGAGRQAVR